MSESLFSSIKETLINCVILENELNDLALKEEHLDNARIIIDTAEKYDAGYVTVTRWGYIGWQKPNKVKLNTTINVAQFGYFDIEYDDRQILTYDKLDATK